MNLPGVETQTRLEPLLLLLLLPLLPLPLLLLGLLLLPPF
jgi:hypothetical protein